MALTIEELRATPAHWATPKGGDWAAGWHAEVTGEGRMVCDEGGRVVARVLGGADWRQQDAFLDLMAASPALAAALAGLVAAVEGRLLPDDCGRGLLEARDAALEALEAAGVAR